MLIKKTSLKIISVVITITLLVGHITSNYSSNKSKGSNLQCNSEISYCSYDNPAAKNTSDEESSQHTYSASSNALDIKNNRSCNLDPLSSSCEEFSKVDSIDINSTFSLQAETKEASSLFIANNIDINSANLTKDSKPLLNSYIEKNLHLTPENNNCNNYFSSSDITSSTELIEMSNEIPLTARFQNQQILPHDDAKGDLITLPHETYAQNVIEKPIYNTEQSFNSSFMFEIPNPEHNPIYSYGAALIQIKELHKKKNTLKYNNAKLKAKIMDIYYISCQKVAIENCEKRIFEMKNQLKTASEYEKKEIIFSLPNFKHILKEEKKVLKSLNQEFSKRHKYSLNIHVSADELCEIANNLVNEQRKNEKNIQKYTDKIANLNQLLIDIHNLLIPLDLNNSSNLSSLTSTHNYEIPSCSACFNSSDTFETSNSLNSCLNHSRYLHFFDNTHRQLIKSINEQITLIESKLLKPESNIKHVIQQCKQLNLLLKQHKHLNNQCINNINNFEKLVTKTQYMLNASEKSQRSALQASLTYFQEMLQELYHEKSLRLILIDSIEKKILQNEEIIKHSKKKTNKNNDTYHKLSKDLNKSIEQSYLYTDLYSNLYSYSYNNEQDD